MAFRKQKLESLLSKLISEYLEIRLRATAAAITITRLEVSNDFKKALIFVTIYPENKTQKVYNELRKAAKQIRKMIGEKLSMKFTPSIEFTIDEGEKNRARIEELITKWKKEK